MFDVIKTALLCQPAMAAMLFENSIPNVPRLRRTRVNDNEGYHDAGKGVLRLQFKEGQITVVDAKTDPKLMFIGTSTWAYKAPRWGSAGIGVVLLGWPTAIILGIPAWIYGRIVASLEQRWGMSIRSRKVLKRIKDQVTPDEYFMVRQALVNLERGKWE